MRKKPSPISRKGVRSDPQAKIPASPLASRTSRSQPMHPMRETPVGDGESLPPLCGCSESEVARLLPRSAGSSGYLWRGRRREMKSTRVRIYPAKGVDGFKSCENWLAEALGATWSRRRGYTVASQARADLFALLASAKVTASRRLFASDKRPYTFQMPLGGGQYTLAEIRRLVTGGEVSKQ